MCGTATTSGSRTATWERRCTMPSPTRTIGSGSLIMRHICGYVEEQRLWTTGCSCHEAECRAAARAHQVFHCGRKSMRGPELHQRIARSKNDLMQSLAELSQTDNFIGEADLQEDLRRLQGVLLAAVDLKFSWTSSFPWTLWRLRTDRSIAAGHVA